MNQTLNPETVKKFAEIFQGNQKACGRLKPDGKGWCEKTPAILEQYALHLSGQKSLGIYPLRDDSLVYFVSSDVDNHRGEDAGELAMKAAAVREWFLERGIVVYVEVSKSGGYHVWLFFASPVPARDARRLMRIAWQAVGGPVPEIFPKQDQINGDQYGNFIHLPYFPPSVSMKRRVMADGGQVIPLEEFIQTIRRYTPEEIATVLGVIPEEENSTTNFRPEKFKRLPTDGSADLMLQNCRFLQHCQLNAETITYDEWLAALTNIVRGSDGIQAAHQVSSMDQKRYKPEDTDKKINEALAMNPQSCEYIQKTFGFTGCPQQGCRVQGPCGWSLSKVAQARAVVRAIPAPSADNVFIPEVLGALAVLKKDDPLEYAKAKASFKGLVNLNDLEKILKQQKNHLHVVQPGETPRTRMCRDTVPDLPIDLVLPPEFSFKEVIIYVKFNENSATPICHKAAGAPVVISERLFNVDTGTEKLEITFRYLSGWRRALFPRSTIFDSRKILQLADYGVPISSDSAKYAVKWFDALIEVNQEQIPIKKAVSKLGWRGDREFVLPNFDNRYRIDIDDDGSQRTVSGFTTAGDYSEWLTRMQYLRQSPKARFILAASFAAPLLRILGHRNFIIHNWGNSQDGKTATLWAAMSAWGNPDRLLGTFDTTATAMERKAALHSDLPLAINEREVLNRFKKDDINPLLYVLGEGRGRSRGTKTGLQDMATWRTVVLSTGEGTLSTSGSIEGVMTRVLEICDGPLAHDREFARSLYYFLPRNHGHAGPEFLKQLLAADYGVIFTTYREFQAAFRASYPDRVDSHIDAVACVATADYLASSWVFGESWEQAKVEAAGIAGHILSGLITRTEASESERAWELFIDWLSANEDRFAAHVAGERFGYRVLNDLFVIRKNLNEFLAKNFSSSAKIVSEWGKAGKIQSFHENGKKTYDTRFKRIEEGFQPRVIKPLKL